MAADVTGNLTQAGIEVLSAPGVSEHIDFITSITYEGQLEAAGKVYLDWYMLTQVRARGFTFRCHLGCTLYLVRFARKHECIDTRSHAMVASVRAVSLHGYTLLTLQMPCHGMVCGTVYQCSSCTWCSPLS